jgi:hypothetical protein
MISSRLWLFYESREWGNSTIFLFGGSDLAMMPLLQSKKSSTEEKLS